MKSLRVSVAVVAVVTTAVVGIMRILPDTSDTRVLPQRLCARGLIAVPGTNFCTHGSDPLPERPSARANCTGLGCLIGLILGPTQTVNPPPPPPPCFGTSEGKRIHLFYAFSGTSDYARQKPLIWGAAGEADRFLNAAGGQHYRFLCDTEGKPVVTEIRVAEGSLSAFITAARAQGHTSSERIYVGMGPGEAATATIDNDDRVSNNANATGPAYSVAGGGSFMHEIGHNLGAVQLSAPHSSKAWHCYDGSDVMCYDDGGQYFQDGGRMTRACADVTWDCGRNDYWRAGGIDVYLSFHWNVFDSPFLTRP